MAKKGKADKVETTRNAIFAVIIAIGAAMVLAGIYFSSGLAQNATPEDGDDYALIEDSDRIRVGDPITGKFIAGKNSRQDTSTLRQVATRLNGEFHNGNVQHISSTMISNLTQKTQQNRWQDLTRREYALIATALGTLILCILPFLLHYFGTRWKPGIV